MPKTRLTLPVFLQVWKLWVTVRLYFIVGVLIIIRNERETVPPFTSTEGDSTWTFIFSVDLKDISSFIIHIDKIDGTNAVCVSVVA